jgi:hypothetical protein
MQATGVFVYKLCCLWIISGGKWLLLHVAFLLLPFTQCLYLILAATSLYIPIMGRIGAGNNAEVIVAVLIGIKFGLLLTCVVSIDTFVQKNLSSMCQR